MVMKAENQLDSLYVIAMGGTGAKCAEAIVHLAATGLFGRSKITFLFVDQDSGNGNLTTVKETIKVYQNCYDVVQRQGISPTNWLSSEIFNLGVYSPLEGTNKRTLGEFFNYQTLINRDLKSLFEVLYTPDEIKAPLDQVGFRGRPAIGAAIFNGIIDQANPQQNNNPNQVFPGQYQQAVQPQYSPQWQALFNDITNSIQNGKAKIFLCGSIFGGTGASGFPTIAKLIASFFQNNRDKVKIGGCLMLPYFNLPMPNLQNRQEVCANSDEFLLRTEAALHYYKNQTKDQFDAIYLLGEKDLPQLAQQHELGGSEQKNQPHFLEFYAALLAKHFLSYKITEQEQTSQQKVVLVTRDGIEGITWNDLPINYRADIKSKLTQTTRFAFAWYSDLAQELATAKEIGVKKFQKIAPWFRRFFKPEQGFLAKNFIGKYDTFPNYNETQQETVKEFNDWSDLYLQWIAKFHYSYEPTDVIQLFNPSKIAHYDGMLDLQKENFSDLVIGQGANDSKTKANHEQISYLKNQLDLLGAKLTEDKGIVGLAKALYKLCENAEEN
jgi:hypothetical protein